MKISRLIKFSRPVPWVPFFVGAYFVGIGNIENLSLLSFLELISLIPLTLFINGLNDIYDRESDKINPRKGDIQGSVICDNEISTVFRFAVISAVPFLIISTIISFINSNFYHLLLSLSFLFLTFAYSHRFFRFRDIPFLDTFIGGTVLCLAPVLIAFSLKNSPINLFSNFWWFALPFMSFHAIAALEDIGPDKKAGLNSIAVFLGDKMTKLFAIILFFIALLFAISYENLFLISIIGINFLNFLLLLLLKEKELPPMVLASFVSSWLIVLLFYFLKENDSIVRYISNLITALL